jgi:F-type H+-transporting ATPase subunit b
MASATLPQLNMTDFEPQIIWLVIVFFIFYSVIKSKIVPYFRSETENRDLYIQNNHQDAKKLQKKADSLSEEYHNKIKAVHIRANHLILEARQKLNHHLEAEKKRLDDDMVSKLDKHYTTLQQDARQVDEQLLSHIFELKQQAQQKIFVSDVDFNNDNFDSNAIKKNGGV